MSGDAHTASADRAHSIVVWRFVDGRAGHENQTLGLVRALARLRPLDTHDIRPRHRGARALLDWLLGRSADGADLPDPDLHLCAGHATHLPMLAAARARGGRRVVLMRPSLPLSLFDLCLAPEHDGLPPGERVLTTRGALNAVTAEQHKRADVALVLLGGPSPHCRWPQAQLLEQVAAVVADAPALRWTVAGSPRTPPATLAALRETLAREVQVLPFEQAPRGWLYAQLATAGRVWVTQDSVSMVYEALSAGAATGLLELPLRRGGRVQRGVATLVDSGMLTPWSAWRAGRALSPPPRRLAEAERCAQWMVERWFNGR